MPFDSYFVLAGLDSLLVGLSKGGFRTVGMLAFPLLSLFMSTVKAAVLLLPMATAFAPDAVALPSTTQLSITLLLSTTQLALPPTSTDCACASDIAPVMPNPSVNAMAALSSVLLGSVANKVLSQSTVPVLVVR